MPEENKGNNIGCIVAIAIAVIGTIVYTIYDMGDKGLADAGMLVIGAGLFAALYFLFKWLKNKEDDMGCGLMAVIGIGALIACSAAFMFLLEEGNLAKGLGILLVIILCCAAGYWLYKNSDS